ncbi:hypothetical protein Dehly_0368 [Dehalogenimonas lykanthroporepellens BL-DC-9]|nr:hypothetical protein Dehly_0368 [Dehalogenimonas lykanthroporepellens BL-DC-9]
MKIGPGELLLVLAVILLLVGASRMKSVTQEVQRQSKAAKSARPATGGAGNTAARSGIKYPQLQLLGILIILGGAATTVIGYLMSQPDVTFLSLVGIGIAAFGIAFIILARRR